MGPGAYRADPGGDGVLEVLTRPDDADLRELVELVAHICDSQAAGITVQRGGEYHVPITHGIEPLVCSSEDTFCRYTMSTDGLFCVEDATVDERFASIGFVDGSLAQARFYASAPIYAPGGEMVGRLCVIDPRPRQLTDLQQRALETLALNVTKLIELRLLQGGRAVPDSRGSAQAASTVVAQLAAELSHDLRVPLSAVIACMEMLTDELSDHPDRTVGALLQRATRAAHRMGRMLDQKLHHGPEEAPERRDVDLDQVTAQLVLDSSGLLEGAGASVDVGELPVVRADPDGMYSVLQNLITNAVKFARPGVAPEIRVAGIRTQDGWRVSVCDNGRGIPEDRRSEVFSLFTRGEHDVAGHGIGLATVARIVAAHGGHVGVEPSGGSGTEIWFELPDDVADAEADAETDAETDAQ